MPYGFLATVVVWGTCTAVALAPPGPRRTRPSSPTFWLAYVVSELPFLVAAGLAVPTLQAGLDGDLGTPVGAVALALALATWVGLGLVVRRGLRARTALEAALARALGPGGPRGRSGGGCWIPPGLGSRWGRVLAWPFPGPGPGVERLGNLAYGPGRHHRLDLYRPRGRPADGPTLVYLHGGAFRHGSKRRGAQPILRRLAARGWTCVSADYRLAPAAVFPDQLVDVKAVLAWVRGEGPNHGADPTRVVAAGSSAGAHLVATAALTSGQAEFQPGFEEDDTTVDAVVALGGYYGAIGTRGPASSPADHLNAGAPPFLVVHGDLDTIVAVDDARDFVARLRAASARPVAYAELPGAHHAFDLFHSIRAEAVADAIAAFAERVAVGVA